MSNPIFYLDTQITPFSINSPFDQLDPYNSNIIQQPTISPPSSPRKTNYPNSPNKIAKTPQKIPFPLSPGKYTPAFPQSPTKINITTPASPNKTTTSISNFAQHAFLNPTETIPGPVHAPFPTCNTPPCSPSKLALQSPRKRSHSAVNNENISPEPKSKKIQLCETNKKIHELLQSSPGSTFDNSSWVKIFEKVGHDNLSNTKLLEAINTEPDALIRQQCLRKLLEVKMSVCSLAWSIFPELDIFSLQITSGYYTEVTAAFFEHSINQFLLHESMPSEITTLIKEGFSKALPNFFPNASAKTQMITDWKNGKPIFLLSGWRKHVTSLLIFNNYVAYGNKGAQHPNFGLYGIKYFLMTKPENFTEDFIERLTSRKDSEKFKEEQMNYLENNLIEQELGLLNFFNLPKTVQKGPGCTNVVCNMNLHSLLFLSSLPKDPINLPLLEITNQLSHSSITAYKKSKLFNRVYNLTQIDELLNHPDIQKIISPKDVFKFSWNIRSRFKLNSFSTAQQNVILSFFYRFIINNPLKIDEFITDFNNTSKISGRISNLLLDKAPTGTFLIRQSDTPLTLIVNYVDQKGKMRSFKIKNNKGNYTHGKSTFSRLQDMVNVKKELTIPFMDSLRLKYYLTP